MSNHNKRGNFGKVNTTIPQESESQSPSPTSSPRPSQPEPNLRRLLVVAETFDGTVEMDLEGNSIEEAVRIVQEHGITGQSGGMAVWYPFHSIRKITVRLR